MVDIHNHILVGADDGPKSIEETIALLQQAKQQGIDDIVVTPHHLHPKYENTFDTVTKGIEELNKIDEIAKLNIQFYPGQEIRLSDQILQDIEQRKIYGINDTKYLLIELPSNEVPRYTKKLLYEIQNKGLVPIIAHPERNKAIARDINLLYGLINNGALSQITASSLNGELGKNLQKISIKMIEHNLIHFIASDAHHVSNRPFAMNNLFNNSKLKNIEADIEMFLQNNEALIQDKYIRRERPIEFNKSKFFGLF
ncbi:tyrosine-protein phosphatase [Mammaliicoccus sciuri]|uniref:tyrosine-protein phosphatase n=1 Tax=Mammaliicoccus sciuri TaxID=1296 RepID=UPI00143294CC|nr:CpsB/CapC family capsule biosynthesis tyrosine phosphatase [Mammaliicoccus sciuri]MCJ1759075.1 capsular biosynthesis protein [Mammaliicoccus sciuri]NKD46803.1 capsular biosynthesis protein [Mammaliicoccus sciuri]